MDGWFIHGGSIPSMGLKVLTHSHVCVEDTILNVSSRKHEILEHRVFTQTHQSLAGLWLDINPTGNLDLANRHESIMFQHVSTFCLSNNRMSPPKDALTLLDSREHNQRNLFIGKASLRLEALVLQQPSLHC